MVGVEIDMVITDSLKALELYEKVFDLQCVEVANFPKGENEVIFTLYGVRFHMLDENPKFSLKAPNPDEPKSIWFNILGLAAIHHRFGAWLYRNSDGVYIDSRYDAAVVAAGVLLFDYIWQD